MLGQLALFLQQAQYSERIMFLPPSPLMIVPILSSLTTFLVIVFGIKSKSHKDTFGKMVIGISASGFLFSFPKWIGSVFPPTIQASCKILQVIAQFGLVSEVMWGAAFGHAFLTISQTYTLETISNKIKYYFFFSVLIPFGLAFGSIFTDLVEISETSGECVNRIKLGQFDYLFLIFMTLPITGSILLSCFFYFKAARNIRNFVIDSNPSYLFVLVIYPAISIICWLPITTVNVLNYFGVTVSPTVATSCQAIDQSQGLIDSIVYGLSKSALRIAVQSMCICFKRVPSESNIQVTSDLNSPSRSHTRSQIENSEWELEHKAV